MNRNEENLTRDRAGELVGEERKLLYDLSSIVDLRVGVQKRTSVPGTWLGFWSETD